MAATATFQKLEVNPQTIHERDLIIPMLAKRVRIMTDRQYKGVTYDSGRQAGSIAEMDNGVVEVIEVRLVL